MRTRADISNYGLVIKPLFDTKAAVMLDTKTGRVSITGGVDVPATLSMTADQRDLYDVAYKGWNVDARVDVDDKAYSWNVLMDQLDAIREHIKELEHLSQNMETLRRLTEKKGA